MSISEREKANILRDAEGCARVIVAWHRELGLHAAPHRMISEGKPQLDSLNKYRQAVSAFSDSDLGTIEAQAKVAKTQISGIFEWFFHEVIPTSLWTRFAADLQFQQPARLFEVAKHIDRLHKHLATIQTSDDESAPSSEEVGRGTTVRFSSRNELRVLAGQHYASYVREEHLGIGGANFLLSSSWERSADLEAESGAITLLTPEYLGFQVEQALQSDHLLSRLRAGEIRIESLEGF